MNTFSQVGLARLRRDDRADAADDAGRRSLPQPSCARPLGWRRRRAATAAMAEHASTGPGVRTSGGGSAMYQAIDPERDADPADVRRALSARDLARPPRARRRPAQQRGASRRGAGSAARSRRRHHQDDQALDDRGQVLRELRLEDRRVEVALRGSAQQRRRTAAPPPPSRSPCCGPSSATAMPRKPIWEIWMSLVAMWNCQPSTSIDAGEAGEHAADRHHQQVVAGDAHAAVAGRLGVEADGAHLVADRSSG